MKSLDDFDLRTLLQLAPDPSHNVLDRFLEFVRGRHHLAQVAYVGPSLGRARIKDPFLLTYSNAFVEHCQLKTQTRNEAQLAGVCGLNDAGESDLEPSLDWTFLLRLKDEVERMLCDACPAGAERQCLVVPVRGPVKGFAALFIVTSDQCGPGWLAHRHDLLMDMTRVANYAHKQASRSSVAEETAGLDAIGDCEVTALKLFAEGNHIGKIAAVMGISVPTAKAHLESARTKMGALNGIHAVAKAYRAWLFR